MWKAGKRRSPPRAVSAAVRRRLAAAREGRESEQGKGKGEQGPPLRFLLVDLVFVTFLDRQPPALCIVCYAPRAVGRGPWAVGHGPWAVGHGVRGSSLSLWGGQQTRPCKRCTQTGSEGRTLGAVCCALCAVCWLALEKTRL